MADKKITKVEFRPDDLWVEKGKHVIVNGEDLAEACPHVWVTYDDSSVEELFSYYKDELHFTAKELKGLTRQEALDLWHKKDKEYLQS